jgi:hypothetical protein
MTHDVCREEQDYALVVNLYACLPDYDTNYRWRQYIPQRNYVHTDTDEIQAVTLLIPGYRQLDFFNFEK